MAKVAAKVTAKIGRILIVTAVALGEVLFGISILIGIYLVFYFIISFF